MSRPSPLLLVLSLVVAAGTAHADPKQHRYVGIHPVPRAEGGGVCHIHAPHVHVYAAATMVGSASDSRRCR